MSGLFDDDPAPPRRPAQPQPRRSRALLATAAVVIAAFFLLSAFTGVWTDKLWFSSVGYGNVFTKVLGTRVLLFVVFGAVLGGIVAANIFVAFRTRPAFRSLPSEANLERYRDAVEPMRKWVVIAVGVLLGLIAGGSASGQWRTFLLWRHGQSFGQEDPYFKKDIGFYVFDLPWLHYMVNFLLMTMVLAFVAAIIVHYLFGGISLQSKGDKVSGAAQVQLSVLLGLFVLFKAVDYWLDRYDLTTEQGRRFTGINYTAFNAVLPSKNILMFIALICALLFFANIFRRTWLLPTVGLGLLVLSAILLGALWPGIVWQFQVRPSQPDKEEDFLAKNIVATRDAYGIADVQEQPYNATVSVTKSQLKESADSLPGIRLIDPARMSQAFEQLQQVRGYYSVAPVLDVDNYPIPGKDGQSVERDLVLGVRELDQSGLVSSQRNWANEHTVYTHGYGIVAAFGNSLTADEEAPPNDDPPWAEEDLPPEGELTDLAGPDGYEGRIYFGEKSPTYSIVGKSGSGINVELDIPEEVSEDRGTTTYDGADGVSVGGVFNKLLYAIKFGEPNIMLSSRVNENSKILYERHPRDRVEKVAPWLTVDGDPYPAVVNGRVVWILDGYTTTDRYPNSERASFRDMTSDALTSTTPYVTLPTDQINYMRNSVKAVVDAYDGTVKLYEWDEEDPILKAWEAIFPGVVEPKSEIDDALMQHLRYPEDMFKVQRFMLAQYHITDPQDFYKGTDLWDVPQDPADTSNKQPPYRLSVQLPPPVADASSTDGSGDTSGDTASDTSDDTPEAPVFSLTSVYVPTNRSNLASYISVDSDATSPTYGQIRVLRLPDSTQVQGPSQISNTFAADERIQNKLLGIKQSSTVVNGNLLTLPVGGGLLYVQPIYALQQSGQGSYPVLQFVLASFGTNAGFGNTLGEAITDVLSGSGSIDDLEDLGGGGQGNNGGKGDGKGDGKGGKVELPADVLSLLRDADAKYADAEAALRDGNPTKWARLQAEAESLVQRALAAAENDAGGPAG